MWGKRLAVIWLPTTHMGDCNPTATLASWLKSFFQNKTFWAASNCCCQWSSTGLAAGLNWPRVADTSCSLSLWMVAGLNWLRVVDTSCLLSLWMFTWMYAIPSNSLVLTTFNSMRRPPSPPWPLPPPPCLPCSPRTTLTAWTGSLLSCRWGLPVWWLDFIHVHRLHLHSCAGRYVGHGQVAEEACGRPAQTSQDVWKDLVYDWRVLNDCKLFNKS